MGGVIQAVVVVVMGGRCALYHAYPRWEGATAAASPVAAAAAAAGAGGAGVCRRGGLGEGYGGGGGGAPGVALLQTTVLELLLPEGRAGLRSGDGDEGGGSEEGRRQQQQQQQQQQQSEQGEAVGSTRRGQLCRGGLGDRSRSRRGRSNKRLLAACLPVSWSVGVIDNRGW